ncbi:furin-like isoform X2 [Mya arenaria]|uniref:furin-like isoform X2 n=1 Tax=Mya arenaria TaxID=6604 RepID=UPI0022E514AD|nr:furin-like isoform X2 [Mya arenaria]
MNFLIVQLVIGILLTLTYVNTLYSNTWLLKGKLNKVEVNVLAALHGLTFIRQIETGHYLMLHGGSNKASKTSAKHIGDGLKMDPRVTYLKQEEWEHVSLRGFTVSDPMWSQSWYLNNQTDKSMGILEAWTSNYTGKGVTIAIVDNGVDINHPDLQNINRDACVDLYDNDQNPLPSVGQNHGTKCAGVAVASKNSICAIGSAFEARYAAIRMIGPFGVTQSAKLQAILRAGVDVSSNSWGGLDGTFDGPSANEQNAFIKGSKLRGGKGVIYVFAGGNGGFDDNCNLDGYVNSIYTIGINGVARDREPPGYAEPCSAILASAYTGKGGSSDNVCTTDVNGGCISSFTGTSAAAPLAAGALALVLESNPNLHWRDIQELIVVTSDLSSLLYAEPKTNAVGRNVSDWFGYGLLNVAAMIKRAKTWTSLSEQHICESLNTIVQRSINPRDTTRIVQSTLYTDSCNETYRCVNRIEHVEAYISFTYTFRGIVELTLESPSGTRSTLLTTRGSDVATNSRQDWTYMSVQFWGENPIGTWKLYFSLKANINQGGSLQSWKLKLYGTGDGCSITTTTPTPTTSPTPSETASSRTSVTWNTTQKNGEKSQKTLIIIIAVSVVGAICVSAAIAIPVYHHWGSKKKLKLNASERKI